MPCLNCWTLLISVPDLDRRSLLDEMATKFDLRRARPFLILKVPWFGCYGKTSVKQTAFTPAHSAGSYSALKLFTSALIARQSVDTVSRQEIQHNEKPRGGGSQMALTKRGKTWHTHLFVDGVRIRRSLATSDWREAQSKEKNLYCRSQTGADLFIA